MRSHYRVRDFVLCGDVGLDGVQVIPNVQSLTADYYRAEDRGKVFGTLHLTSAAGAALGGLYATNVGAPHLLACKQGARAYAVHAASPAGLVCMACTQGQFWR